MVIDQLLDRGIRDPLVLAAFAKLPRHLFVPQEHRLKSYTDQPLPIGEKQTISQPYIAARMTEELRVAPGMKVLEIGTGSGYQTAILSLLGAKVYSMERLPELAQAAIRRLADLGYSGIEVRVGDGSLGWMEEAPFDRILVTAAAPAVPKRLASQLAQESRMVIPIGEPSKQTLTVVERLGERFQMHSLGDCIFVPLVSP